VRVRRELRRVAPLLRPAAAGPDNVQIDAARRVVSAHGRSITLTTREFAVFRCLTESSGATLSREEILRRAWGDQKYRPSTGIVGVYVLYVRRKLTKLGLAHTLRTVKGQGYSFTMPGEYWTPGIDLAATTAARSRSRRRDLHATARAGRAGAANDDLDVATQPQKHANQPVRRKAL
jgi:DNA-binding winged helix-turn-helix (wHTH) protein